MIENLQKCKKKSKFGPFVERTESVSFLLSSPLPGSSQVAGFLFSVSQKNRARYSYLSRWELFPFLMEQRYEFSNKLQIITEFISIVLTYFKHYIFMQLPALQIRPNHFYHTRFSEILLFLIFMYLIGSGHVQMLWHISITPTTPDGRVPMQRGAGFSSHLGQKKTSPTQEH